MPLSIVATPIGNLEDISARALRTLREADIILCEDTRVTKKLLSRYDIHAATMSYHANSREAKSDRILAMLAEGKNLALVSDSGMPCISDPGVQLVSKARERFGDEVMISVIPGPSALIAALALSGLPASDFLFLGFLPRKKGRKTLFEETAGSKRTVAFYESPYRVMKTLEEMRSHLEPERKIAIARELTKIHEEFLSGTVDEILEKLRVYPEKQRGEFVILVEGRK
ncbi:MAG TPA: 16S rRNA (cytidine(1402)-2'-O)-methyltransferase [Candidatus Paceibacterota bacterium]|nr:16S rRNA (cytidine(1402)-2'-O)-methyltransferase [Candidatus Paceibacterota bacterium]